MSDRIRDMFADDGNELAEKVGKAAEKLTEIVGQMEEAKATDTARWDALNEERKAQAAILSELKTTQDKARVTAEHEAAMAETKAFLAQVRTPSKALAFGFGRSIGATSYAPGSFIAAVHQLRSNEASQEDKANAKAVLDGIGSRWADVPPDSKGVLKSTTGLTDAAGGWLVPNALVDDIIKVGKYTSGVMKLVDSRRGYGGAGAIDIPYRTTDTNKALVIPWGSLKTNVDVTYSGYTATLYTIAKIYDVSKQLLRKSAGAVERDVLDELARAFALAESYYTLQGSGSSEPYGLQTAISNAPGTYTSTTVAAAATRAGSIITIIANLAGTLADRNRTPEGAIMAPGAFWTLAAQGTENAGFFLDVLSDPMSPTLRIFGIATYPESQLAGSDDLIVGEFSALKVYFGDGYRVDSSDIAGTRWDYNLVGFRGEEEMGLDARPAVYAGAFQFQADILP